MNAIPRTFCITLRETPKRREEARKYLNQVGLNAELFDGIHGQTFGLKSTVPNYATIPGREYFITQGAVGCILSHLMLWNVLVHLPEEEFLIVEDDIILCEDFANKFIKFRLDLPEDWEIAYVGWNPPGDGAKETPKQINEHVIVTKTACTHAYLVKKSALRTLIETNKIAWSPLDLQIVERSLPKLRHYASNPPLITQRSECNLKNDIWASLCYDWSTNPEWLMEGKKLPILLGTGWYPLEKNAEGYMIWSDGRGELLFGEEWDRIEFDFIAEGEMDKHVRVVCPTQPDQGYEVRHGLNRINASVGGAKSIIIVSDTFKPIDIYKTSDCRQLGLRILRGFTLIDKEGKRVLISLYSMYGQKKFDGNSKAEGTKIFHDIESHKDGKINLNGQISFNHHRSGWNYVLNLLVPFHRDDASVFDGFLENNFSWKKDENSQLRLIPYREPWVGVFHNPPNTPNWFTNNGTPYSMIMSKEFQESLGTCQGIYVLSNYHKDFLKCYLKNIPVETLYLPTETPELKFNFDEFIKNNNKKVINVGWWCRKLSSIYQLEVENNVYQKIRLLPPLNWVPEHMVEQIIEIEAAFNKKKLSEEEKRTVVDVRHMPDVEYDEILTKNLVFIDLYDASANNVVVECIARGTPILVNPIPSVVEYLGEEYPFYFTSLAEASKKLKNVSLIKFTHEYLMTSGVREKVSGENFLKTIQEGEIWKSLS